MASCRERRATLRRRQSSKTRWKLTSFRDTRGYGAGCIHIHIPLPNVMTGFVCTECGEEGDLQMSSMDHSLYCGHCGEKYYIYNTERE
jgi:DNA-directed RNA polymerase subunit RPC12/RpoP